jgi:chromosome segregation ATPase
MSIFLMLLVTGICACVIGAAVVSYFVRRTNTPADPGAHDAEVALARLQEKEKFLVEQLDKYKAQILEYESSGNQQSASLGEFKEKLAAADERLIGLEREIARERELANSLETRLQNEAEEERVVKDVLQGRTDGAIQETRSR